MPLLRRNGNGVHRGLPLHQLHRPRSFVEARIKWVPDPYLDNVVLREKNLRPMLSLKNLILSSPTHNSLSLSAASAAKTSLSLPTPAVKFIQKYPSVFRQFQPHPKAFPHVRLTRQTLAVHRDEAAIHASPDHRAGAAERLAKLLMLCDSRKLPVTVINRFQYDLGLPHNYILTLLTDFPEYFEVCSLPGSDNGGSQELALQLVCWREDLAVSAIEQNAMSKGLGFRKGMRLSFPMQLPRGFDFEKKVQSWVEEWQNLPYMSPYENAFHLTPSSDQAEKWVVAVLHELLHILVSKKTEKDNVYCLGDYLGFGSGFKRVLKHHPGIFYVSNKVRTQTVVLREAYRKDFLVLKHPLMGLRHRYIHLMNKSKNRRKPVPPIARPKALIGLSAEDHKGENTDV